MYQPTPIRTTGLELPEELGALAERLAEHVHDLWVLERMSLGWQHAGVYDEGKMHDPRLVPFGMLAGRDREITRHKSQQTMRALVAMGTRIEVGGAMEAEVERVGDETDEIERILKGNDLAALRAAWDSLRDAEVTEGLCVQIGGRILKIGEPLIAFDILSDGIRMWPKSVRLRQLTALALSRSGAPHQANEILSNLFREGNTDGETLGLLARTHKDLADAAEGEAETLRQSRMALGFYEQGYKYAMAGGRTDEAYYTGINAATLALLAGDKKKAAEIGEHVRVICREKLAEAEAAGNDGGSYWLRATLGEVALVLGDFGEADEHYSEAAKLGVGEWASLNSTRKQAERLMRHLGRDVGELGRMFRIPPVAVFSGHMVDRPDRPVPRFRSSDEGAVGDAISEALEASGAAFGYASAACGGDVLFLERMLDRGGEIHVVLPCPPDEFRAASVDGVAGDEWGGRYERLMKRASSVVETGGAGALNTEWAFEYANRVTIGLALLRAETLGTEVKTVAVWDGKVGDGIGGADSAVKFWRSVGLPPVVVSPDPKKKPVEVKGIGEADDLFKASTKSATRRLGAAELVVMLFGDAVRFSRLTETQLPLFIEDYLGAVADLAKTHAGKPITANTWGDGLFMVFSDVRDAGMFALDLARRISGTDWESLGLPADLNIRLALHVGPAIAVHDPLTDRLNYLGSHVSRAARIEPITPPGRVYASQPFASLAAAQRIKEFSCDYVGRTPLAKGYGTFPTYHVRPGVVEA